MRKVSILIGALLVLAFFHGCGEKKSGGQAEIHQITQEELGKKASCPVCGMRLMVSSRTPAADYEGKTYYFCKEGDRTEFMKNPGKFASKQREEAKEKKPAEKIEEEPEIAEEEVKALGYEFHKVTQEDVDQIALCSGCDKYLVVSSQTPALAKEGEVFYFCSKTCLRIFVDRGKSSP